MQLLRSFLLLRLFPVLLVCCLLLGGHARPGASVVAGVLVWKTSICRRSNHTSTLRVEPLVRASNPYIRGRLAEAVFIIECILYIYNFFLYLVDPEPGNHPQNKVNIHLLFITSIEAPREGTGMERLQGIALTIQQEQACFLHDIPSAAS